MQVVNVDQIQLPNKYVPKYNLLPVKFYQDSSFQKIHSKKKQFINFEHVIMNNQQFIISPQVTSFKCKENQFKRCSRSLEKKDIQGEQKDEQNLDKEFNSVKNSSDIYNQTNYDSQGIARNKIKFEESKLNQGSYYNTIYKKDFVEKEQVQNVMFNTLDNLYIYPKLPFNLTGDKKSEMKRNYNFPEGNKLQQLNQINAINFTKQRQALNQSPIQLKLNNNQQFFQTQYNRSFSPIVNRSNRDNFLQANELQKTFYCKNYGVYDQMMDLDQVNMIKKFPPKTNIRIRKVEHPIQMRFVKPDFLTKDLQQ